MSERARNGFAPRGDGGHIGYSVLGEGPPLAFWPGGTLSAASLLEEPRCARFQRQMGSFSTRIAIDRRGVGISDPLGVGQEATTDLLVNDVLAVLDHLGIEKVVLSANGWDGQSMVHLAVRHPDRVAKLILMSFSPCPTTRPDWPYGVPLDVIGALQGELAAPDEGREPQDIAGLLAPSAAGDRHLRDWFEASGRVGPATAAAYVANTMTEDVRPILDQVSMPTLILHSTGDRWTPIEGARFCAERIPDSRLVEFDSADHFSFIDHLDERLAEMESFIQDGTRAHAKRCLRTVLFTDVVGSTELLAATRDVRWAADLDAIDSTVSRHVRHHDGRVCKSMGDGHLALFERPSDAVAAALDLVRALGSMGTPIRAGLHIGEVELRGDDVAGVAVHVGARVSGIAGAGEVLVTRTVGDLLAGSAYALDRAGDHVLKGLPGNWPLFRVSARA